MREQLGILLIGLGFVGGCGAVESSVDAPPGTIDAPPGGIDAPDLDGPPIDAPPGTIDAPMTVDAPPGPTPMLYWAMDGNVNNTGALSGYTLQTPAGISYATGKFGMAASYSSTQYSFTDGGRTTLGTYADVTIGFWMRAPTGLTGSVFFDNNNRSTAPYGGIQLALNGSLINMCAATTSSSYLGGSCLGFNSASGDVWHHYIVRYDGTGTGTGQGGPVEVYIDDVLVHTRANDGNNNPVFNSTGMVDRMTMYASGGLLDDVRIYNQVFTRAEQCTYVMRGTWTGSACTPP
jgi:hypothetical protein